MNHETTFNIILVVENFSTKQKMRGSILASSGICCIFLLDIWTQIQKKKKNLKIWIRIHIWQNI